MSYTQSTHLQCSYPQGKRSRGLFPTTTLVHLETLLTAFLLQGLKCFFQQCQALSPTLNHDYHKKVSDCSLEAGDLGLCFESAKKMMCNLYNSLRTFMRDVQRIIDLTCNSEKLRSHMTKMNFTRLEL